MPVLGAISRPDTVTVQEPSVEEVEIQGVIRNSNVQRSENSDVHQYTVTVQEPSDEEVEIEEGFIRNGKCRAPNPSNFNTVVKKKSEVSEEVSDPVPGPGIFYTVPFHQSIN